MSATARMTESRGQAVARLRDLARLLDEAIPIPGTGLRIGLDALIGLIPGAGDLAGAAFSALVIVRAAGLGAPASVLARMLGTVAVDTILGAIPVLGDLFDAGWKSNTRNVRLLERWVESPRATRAASRTVVIATLAAILALLAAGVSAAVWLTARLLAALG